MPCNKNKLKAILALVFSRGINSLRSLCQLYVGPIHILSHIREHSDSLKAIDDALKPFAMRNKDVSSSQMSDQDVNNDIIVLLYS